MAAFNKFNATSEDWLLGLTVYGTDTFKVMLTNTAPVATNHVYGDISAAEVANGGGYTTGGATVTMTPTTGSGVAKVTASAASPTWTGSVGGFGPFRYAVIYDSSAVTKTLQGWYDYGSSISLAAGDTFTVAFDGTNGFFTVT